MSATLSFGLRLPQEISDPGVLRELAQEAERRGFHSLWFYDHFFHFPTASNTHVLEVFTAMTAVASWTKSIRVGSLVLCNGYRPPALTAKISATLDVLSGGRLELGYGAGWHEEEHRAYGYDFPAVAPRIARMEEALQIIRSAWTEGAASFAGRHYQVEQAICEPRPVQQPHPPITIGGGGEKLLLRAVARHADWWNYFPVALPEYEQKAAVLKEHCERLGRDPASVRRSLTMPLMTAPWEKEVRDQLEGARQRGIFWALSNRLVQGTPDIVVPRFRDYARRGVSLFILVLPDPTDLKQLEFIERSVIAELD